MPESVVNDCNERIVRHGLNVIRSAESEGDGDGDNTSGAASSGDQPAQSVKGSPNQGTLLIDATCVSVDIRYPTDLSLLNEAREVTEMLIHAMHPQVREPFGDMPRTHPKKARQRFLTLALAEGFCEAVEEAISDQQDPQGHSAATESSAAESGLY